MYKKAFFSASLLFLFFTFAPTTRSQEPEKFDFNQAYQDYVFKADVYRNVHNDYKVARGQYLNFQTLKSKTNAEENTSKMLEARDEVVGTYMTALRMRLLEAPGVSEDVKEDLFVRIDAEVAWFNEHKEILSSAGSLEDLVADSEDASEKFTSIDPLFYEVLTVVSGGKPRSFRERLNSVVSDLTQKLNEIKAEEREEYKFSQRKIQTIERWLLEIENQIRRSEEKQREANDIAISKKKGSGINSYNKAIELLNESHQYLKEANSFVKEIIREIKTEEM